MRWHHHRPSREDKGV
ncbi:UNVERIFIED_CONTAM: hypothetical protein GTU68_040145 [Idotea baltica]|nr:hypothetical protein [Idotea baltica]